MAGPAEETGPGEAGDIGSLSGPRVIGVSGLSIGIRDGAIGASSTPSASCCNLYHWATYLLYSYMASRYLVQKGTLGTVTVETPR